MSRFKFKVKYYGINYKFIFYFYVLLVSLYLILSFSIINENLFIIKKSIGVTLIVITVYLIVTSKLSPFKMFRIKASLKKVIIKNKLFIENKDIIKIVTSLIFKFYKKKNLLIVEAYPNGIDFISKLERLGKVIETALNLPLVDTQNNKANCYTYTFSITKPKRLIVNLQLFNNMKNGFIKLDSEKVWDFNKYPHGIVAGKTGGGKTYFLYFLILSFLYQGAQIYIGDPKEKDLYSLKHFIGNDKVQSTPNGIAKILRKMSEEMSRRNEIMTANGLNDFGKDYRNYNLPPVVGIFDEISVLKSVNSKVADEIDVLLNKVVSKGRQYGIFVILATQRPDATTINTNVRDQLSLRVSLGKLYKDGLKMTLGDDFDELPSGEQVQGKGFIYIDGLSWSMPRSYSSPLFKGNEIELFKTITQLKIK